MQSDRVPLYVRLPRDQAAELDRLVDRTGQRKQQLVSDLLADRLQMGRIELRELSEETMSEVMTLAEVAELLRLPAETIETSAKQGKLPGRLLGSEWRFTRSAVLQWLSGETPLP